MTEYVGQDIFTVLQLRGGISRVVVNNAGESVSNEQLDQQMAEMLETEGANGLKNLQKFAPHIMFIRNDGWILAASPKFEKVAYELWKDAWVGFVKCPDEIIEDIVDYVPGPQDF
jgi:hypothetical protein